MRTAGYYRQDCKRNSDILKESQHNTFMQNYRPMLFECHSQESHSKLSTTNQRDEDSGETLQTLAWDRNRPHSLKRGRQLLLTMMMNMLKYCSLLIMYIIIIIIIVVVIKMHADFLLQWVDYWCCILLYKTGYSKPVTCRSCLKSSCRKNS
jgi:hypothetical protein